MDIPSASHAGKCFDVQTESVIRIGLIAQTENPLGITAGLPLPCPERFTREIEVWSQETVERQTNKVDAVDLVVVEHPLGREVRFVDESESPGGQIGLSVISRITQAVERFPIPKRRSVALCRKTSAKRSDPPCPHPHFEVVKERRFGHPVDPVHQTAPGIHFAPSGCAECCLGTYRKTIAKFHAVASTPEQLHIARRLARSRTSCLQQTIPRIRADHKRHTRQRKRLRRNPRSGTVRTSIGSIMLKQNMARHIQRGCPLRRD